MSLAIAPGSIHGLVGENGAGKSTLMGILSGYHRADRGRIAIRGRPVAIASPRDALAAGIGMVHQHFMLVEPFTVAENVVLGAEGGFRIGRTLARARAELARLGREYALEVDPDARVADLDVGQRQRAEILKALYRRASVLILDEPTAVLAPQEADHLFRVLRALRDEGHAVVLVTHKLREVGAVTDVVTVMRDGRIVATLRTADSTPPDLAELMVGRRVDLRVDKRPAQRAEPILEVVDLTVSDALGRERVKHVSFVVRRGEIVGVAGVAGNGQSELLEALAGMRPAAAGRIVWKGREVDRKGSPRELRRLGLGHVPEDRQRMGLVPELAARESAILGRHAEPAYNGAVLLRRRAVQAAFEHLAAAYDVRPRDGELATAAFSGGNQQKIVLGRELEAHPELLLVGQPTRGLDVGATEFVHRRLLALRDEGRAVLLVSVDLDEVLALADRIIVMHGGRIVGELAAGTATARAVGLLMAGVTSDDVGIPSSARSTTSGAEAAR